jgi:hypothetical protein
MIPNGCRVDGQSTTSLSCLNEDQTPQKGIFVNQPFLSTRFGGKDVRLQPMNPGHRSHRLPKLLALGIMLLEIELNIKIEEHRLPADLNDDGKPNVNADHHAAVILLKKNELWEEKETIQVVKKAIAICLMPDEFKDVLKDKEGIRVLFRKSIVESLYAAYKLFGGDSVRPITLNSPTVPLLGSRKNQYCDSSSRAMQTSLQLIPLTLSPRPQTPSATTTLDHAG